MSPFLELEKDLSKKKKEGCSPSSRKFSDITQGKRKSFAREERYSK